MRKYLNIWKIDSFKNCHCIFRSCEFSRCQVSLLDCEGPTPRIEQKTVARSRDNLETWRGDDYDGWSTIQLTGLPRINIKAALQIHISLENNLKFYIKLIYV